MKYFKLSEFVCRCGSTTCNAVPMREPFLAKMDALRELWGRPLIVTSGMRCSLQNALVGGAPNSQHLLGNAADILVSNIDEALELEMYAEKVGMGGVGMGMTFIHVDDGPPGRRWTY